MNPKKRNIPILSYQQIVYNLKFHAVNWATIQNCSELTSLLGDHL